MENVQRTVNRRAFVIAGLGAAVSVKAAHAQPATPAASPVAVQDAIYRVELAASSLPAAPVAVGAAGVLMSAGTTIVYPDGSAGPSVGIDHILSGGYEITTDSELIHLAADGKRTEIAAGETTTVATGETIVLLQNQAAQRIVAQDAETRTLAFGFFSLEQGTNESDVEGSLEQEMLGGTVLRTLPQTGVVVTLAPGEDAALSSESIVQLPISLENGKQLMLVVQPLDDN